VKEEGEKEEVVCNSPSTSVAEEPGKRRISSASSQRMKELVRTASARIRGRT
jgi:hypothetical protein